MAGWSVVACSHPTKGRAPVVVTTMGAGAVISRERGKYSQGAQGGRILLAAGGRNTHRGPRGRGLQAAGDGRALAGSTTGRAPAGAGDGVRLAEPNEGHTPLGAGRGATIAGSTEGHEPLVAEGGKTLVGSTKTNTNRAKSMGGTKEQKIVGLGGRSSYHHCGRQNVAEGSQKWPGSGQLQ